MKKTLRRPTDPWCPPVPDTLHHDHVRAGITDTVARVAYAALRGQRSVAWRLTLAVGLLLALVCTVLSVVPLLYQLAVVVTGVAVTLGFQLWLDGAPAEPPGWFRRLVHGAFTSWLVGSVLSSPIRTTCENGGVKEKESN